MTSSTLRQSLTPALTTWEEVVTDEGPVVDLTETNRTRLCITRFETFLEEPTADSFRALWSPETLANYWRPTAGALLGEGEEVEHLHVVLSEMDDADEFNTAWLGRTSQNSSGWGFRELFARLEGGSEPIPTSEAKEVLDGLGYDVNDNPDSVVDAILKFKQEYDRHVGHASADTPNEIPIYAEMDEFFRLVNSTPRETINAQLTGEYAPLFRPLIGHQIHTESAEPFQWSGVDELIEDHVEARDSEAYDDYETEHWGGTHIESWKWEYRDYFQEVVRSEFDLTKITPDEVPALLEAIEEPTRDIGAVSNVPAKMMGGQFHRLAWGDIVDHCLENPDEAAVVLSDLFDEELPIVDRLNEFQEFLLHLTTREENDRSPGSLLRAATALLMYAYPNRHINFQYQRMDNFFQEYSTSDGLDMGFNSPQYREVAIASRDLLKRIEDNTGDASMIDVQTLFYVADDRD